MPFPAAAVFVRERLQAATIARALKNSGLFAEPIYAPPDNEVASAGIKKFVEMWYEREKKWVLIVLESNYTSSGPTFEFSSDFFIKMPEAYFILNSGSVNRAAKSFLALNTLKNIYPIEWIKDEFTTGDKNAAIDGARKFLLFPASARSTYDQPLPRSTTPG